MNKNTYFSLLGMGVDVGVGIDVDEEDDVTVGNNVGLCVVAIALFGDATILLACNSLKPFILEQAESKAITKTSDNNIVSINTDGAIKIGNSTKISESEIEIDTHLLLLYTKDGEVERNPNADINYFYNNPDNIPNKDNGLVIETTTNASTGYKDIISIYPEFNIRQTKTSVFDEQGALKCT